MGTSAAVAVTGEGALTRGWGVSANRKRNIQSKKDKLARRKNLFITSETIKSILVSSLYNGSMGVFWRFDGEYERNCRKDKTN